MSPRLWFLVVSSLAALFALGLILGQRIGRRPAAPASAAPELPVAPWASADTSALEAAERRGQRLQRQVETLELAVHAARDTVPPEPAPVAVETTPPVEFPEDLPEQFTPVGFERIVRDLVRDCELGVDVAEIDCSEYPCLAWVRSRDLEQPPAFPSRCDAWKGAFGEGSTVTYHLEGNPFGGRTERYHVWVATPTQDRDANQPLIRRGEQRMNARWDAMHAGSNP